jgi:NADPH:quinone reductase-like Zn-dependent oxidoreductase
MKASNYVEQGKAQDELYMTEVEEPTPSSGEVQIAVAYAGVNPGEVKNEVIPWFGQAKGGAATPGVYAYRIVATSKFDGIFAAYQGHVTLLR